MAKGKFTGGRKWLPGTSGNPAGRPKKGDSYAELYRLIGDETAEDIKKVKSSKYMTRKEVTARIVWKLAMDGTEWAIKHIVDRIEGRAIQQIEHSGKSPDEIWRDEGEPD